MTNLDSILKSRDITLSIKFHLVKALAFPAVMYGCESWSIKKAEHGIIDAFELWCWKRLLRVPWTAKRSNQSILKEISPEYSLERLMLKLKLQYSGHLMWRTDSLEKTLILGKIEGGRRSGWQRMRWLDGITDRWTLVWISSGSWWWTGKPGVLQSMGSQRVGHNWATELNWSEQNIWCCWYSVKLSWLLVAKPANSCQLITDCFAFCFFPLLSLFHISINSQGCLRQLESFFSEEKKKSNLCSLPSYQPWLNFRVEILRKREKNFPF